MEDLYSRSRLPRLPPPMGWSSPPRPHSFLNANTFFHISPVDFAPTKVLNERIRARDWDSARIRVLSHPSDSKLRSKQLNNATPLHLACLYRAPADLVQLVLEANPEALFAQDSEGWTPLHVILLYGSDEETALLLIQRGGYRAASVQSRIVGAPLHLACRHGCSTAILRELLRANPTMATTANEYSTKPATILWHHFSRNPENERLLNELWEQEANRQGDHSPSNSGQENRHQSMKDLVDRLTLLVRAAKGKHNPHHHNTGNKQPAIVIHDVVGATDENLGDLTQYLSLIVLLYPEQVRAKDEMGNLPLHNAASTTRRMERNTRNLRRTVSMPAFATAAETTTTTTTTTTPLGALEQQDPIHVLLQSYPLAASIPNHQGLLPLHIALWHGQRTWKSGIASMVGAAPHVLMTRDPVSNLLPFQLAAATLVVAAELEIIETILELLLACPHAMMTACAAAAAAPVSH